VTEAGDFSAACCREVEGCWLRKGYRVEEARVRLTREGTDCPAAQCAEPDLVIHLAAVVAAIDWPQTTAELRFAFDRQRVWPNGSRSTSAKVHRWKRRAETRFSKFHMLTLVAAAARGERASPGLRSRIGEADPPPGRPRVANR